MNQNKCLECKFITPEPNYEICMRCCEKLGHDRDPDCGQMCIICGAEYEGEDIDYWKDTLEDR